MYFSQCGLWGDWHPQCYDEHQQGGLDVVRWICRWKCQTGDVVKAANGQTATLIRKTPRENRAILEISVDDSKMRVTPSHRLLTPKDGGHVVPDVQRLQRSELDVFGCGACPIEP